MFKVKVERVINKPIEEVFEAISDHANYQRFPGVSYSALLEEGTDERNGKGALRRIHGGPVKFDERITEFERPTKMAYLIEHSSPVNMRHDRGEITLTAQGDKTHVLWESEGHLEVPILGNWLDKKFEKKGGQSFGAILKSIDAA